MVVAEAWACQEGPLALPAGVQGTAVAEEIRALLADVQETAVAAVVAQVAHSWSCLLVVHSRACLWA